MRRTLALTAALAAAGTAAISASADTTRTARVAADTTPAARVAADTTPAGRVAADTTPTARIAAKAITNERVGQVRLGMTFSELRDQGLVGKLRRGCELAGPDARIARLRSPLRGFVDFTQSTPRKVTNILVTRGARARGVRVGDRIKDIKGAYPGAKVNRKTEEVFGIWLVRVPKSDGGLIRFSVPVATKRIDAIGVPAIPFCE